ncbi:MAG: quinoprotein dehydrogenase-associated putative ABC transporter substrate-binding protein [Gammaproteobacteria bacterium]
MDAKTALSLPRAWLAVAFAAAVGPAQAADGELFKVCAPPYTKPMSDMDGSGYENRIAEMFAAQLGQKTSYTWFPQRMGFIRATLRNNETEDGSYKCDYVMGVVENFELAATTRPYMHSTWAMLVRKGAGVDWIETQDDLKKLDEARRQQLKIGIWDQGPTTEWISKLDLIERATPYPMMSGDPKQSPADVVGAAFDNGEVNVSFLWGPLAGHLAKQHPDVKMIPLTADEGIKFDFQIAMAVRHGDERRLELLDGLIEKNQGKIDELLAGYGVPLLELHIDEKRKDDDDD